MEEEWPSWKAKSVWRKPRGAKMAHRTVSPYPGRDTSATFFCGIIFPRDQQYDDSPVEPWECPLCVSQCDKAVLVDLSLGLTDALEGLYELVEGVMCERDGCTDTHVSTCNVTTNDDMRNAADTLRIARAHLTLPDTGSWTH